MAAKMDQIIHLLSASTDRSAGATGHRLPTDVAKRAQEVVDARTSGDRQRADRLMRHLEEWYEARVRRAEAEAPPDTAKVVRLRTDLAEARRYVDRETAAAAATRVPRSEAESDAEAGAVVAAGWAFEKGARDCATRHVRPPSCRAFWRPALPPCFRGATPPPSCPWRV